MDMNGAIITAAAVVAFAFSASTARAGERQCDNGEAMVELSTDAECELVSGLDCEAKCDPVLLEAGCITKAAAQCDAECGVQAALQCGADCGLSCHAGCTADVEAVCQAACTADCGVACATECNLGDLDCLASCEAQCGADCKASCEADASLDCAAECEGSCEAQCKVDAAVECAAACEADASAQCVADLKLKCDLACKTDGALFCDGAFMSGAEATPCIHAVQDMLEADIPDKRSDADPEVAQGCSVGGAGAPTGSAVALVAFGLMGLLARRRS